MGKQFQSRQAQAQSARAAGPSPAGRTAQGQSAAPQSNRSLAALLRSAVSPAVPEGLPAQLPVNVPGDRYEQEADRVADAVVRMPEPGARLQRKCAECDQEELQRKQAGTAPPTAPPVVSDVLGSPGRPLDVATLSFMEPRFGSDFSQVRVHTDDRAAQSARAVNARAYTVGSHIVFADGQFSPGSGEGRRLLAHELTHTIQQGGGEPAPGVSLQASPGGMLMRQGFESTVSVCHQLLNSRTFRVDSGGVRVTLLLNQLDREVPNCQDFDFGVTLTEEIDWWPDNEIATCRAKTGGTRSFAFGGVPKGKYYLTIWRTFDHPYCCLTGDIVVADEAVSGDSGGCARDKDPSVMDIVHGALSAAGFIPALGAIPDGIDALIYVIEGDWANAGISAVAMVPAFGDGAKLIVKGGKEVVEASGKTVVRMGEEQLAQNLKNVSRSGGREAAQQAAKEVITSAPFVRGRIRFRWRGTRGAFDALANAPPGAQVYVFRDAAGSVMYVGYTERGAVTRAGEHLYQKAGDFLGDAATVEVKGVGLAEREARALEQDLIDEFKPKWNRETDSYTKIYKQPPPPEEVRAANNAFIRLELLFD